MRPSEAATRQRLGIPEDAEQVLVFTESSHWDPNWVLTAEQYFRLGVRRTLDLVLDELDRDERRVWSADCIFYLAMYWDRRPAHRDRLASAVNSGRLRLTSSGVTTQDTLLPSTESVLRDFLVGQEWLRERGMHQEPHLAYFPDSFGHSPALPSLLTAAGFDQTMVTRINGCHFIGADWEPPSRFPRPGSSAETLSEAGSADFVWRDRTGAEVLAHWHPFTYGQGDMLASVGLLRYMSAPISIPDRSRRRVATRIERYAAQLAPLARTPYLLCPIGLDFINPIRDLWGLLDRYNEERFGDSGLWVTNAGADDYLALIADHRAELPVLELDPNPYWTGFYASRPELKRSHRRLVDGLVTAEAEAVVAGPAAAARTAASLAEPWWTAVTANHHDFVTGTAPDRVVRNEQEPWLRSAQAVLDRVSGTPLDATDVAVSGATPSRQRAAKAVEFDWDEQVLRVVNGEMVTCIDSARGGCITTVATTGTGVAATQGGPIGDLIAYDDAGGLWRMGGEYLGGHFTEIDRTSHHRAEVATAATSDGGLEITVVAELDGSMTERRYRFEPGRAAVTIETRCAAGERRTITLGVKVPGPIDRVAMDQPGGVIVRPAERHFKPTFWPVSSWMTSDQADRRSTSDWAVAVEMTRAVAAGPDGDIEVIVARNATKERAWGVVPILACPAKGHEPNATSASVGVWFPKDRSPAALYEAVQDVLAEPARSRLDAAAASVVEIRLDGEDAVETAIEVLAVKPASRGDGTIIRFIDRAYRDQLPLRLRTALPIVTAATCDVRERDLESLEPVRYGEGSEISLRTTGSITSVRLVEEL